MALLALTSERATPAPLLLQLRGCCLQKRHWRQENSIAAEAAWPARRALPGNADGAPAIASGALSRADTMGAPALTAVRAEVVTAMATNAWRMNKRNHPGWMSIEVWVMSLATMHDTWVRI